MAAATQSVQKQFALGNGSYLVLVHFSAMTSGQIETLSYNYGSLPAALPAAVWHRIATDATARCAIEMSCPISTGSASAKTVPVRFYTEAGGDISGAEIDVYLLFTGPGATEGGITPV